MNPPGRAKRRPVRRSPIYRGTEIYRAGVGSRTYPVYFVKIHKPGLALAAIRLLQAEHDQTQLRKRLR